MAVSTRAKLDKFEMPPEPVRRFTVAEYHQLINIGIFAEDEAFELLEGWVVPKVRGTPAHDTTCCLAEDELSRVLPPDWVRGSRAGLTTSDSEPEPDAAIVRGPRRRYCDEHPGPTDTCMVAEVSDVTLQRDRTIKQRIFDRAAIPIYWIVNLPDRQIEVYTDPSGPTNEPKYGKRLDYGENDAVPLVIAGVELARIPVKDLLP